MTIKGSLSYKDYRKYFLFYARTRYAVNFLLFFVAFSMINISLSVGKILFECAGFAGDILLAFIAALFLTLVMAALFFLRVRVMYRRNERLRIENEYIVKDDGILIRSERGEYLLKWPDLTKAFAFRNLILIYSGGDQAVILPRSYFGTDRDWTDFKAVLKDKIVKTRL